MIDSVASSGVLILLASAAEAQLQQNFVYTTGGGVATRNDATGVNAPTGASPLAVLGFPAVLDAKGRFLFAAGNNSIHMYQVDSLTGSYTEVPGSPFASANTNADNAAGSPQSIFPVTTQGLASAPISIAITNGGAAPMHISNISAGGSSAADFTNSVASCATTAVAANASCTINVIFSPLFSGPCSETLTVTDDASNSPHVLNIGASAPPAFSISSPSTSLSATVAAGQTASYALQLTPGLDYNGTISLTCTGVPLGATCQVPASVVLNVGAPASLTVTVLTSGNAMACPKFGSRRAPRAPPLPTALTIALGMLLFMVFLRFYRAPGASSRPIIDVQSSRRKIIYAALAVLIFVPIIFAADGCGGGSTTTPAAQKSSIVTPSGTSTLVITPTASNAAGKPLQWCLFS